jgi:protein gp37
MGDKSGIEWTDATWNPVRGCSPVSTGCKNCYAETVAARFSGPGQPYEGLVKITTRERILRRDHRDGGVSLQRVEHRDARWNGVVRMVPEHLADPLRWRKPRRIFVNSMSDLFHEALTNEQIAAVFGVMAAAPRHTFQVLTKRAERMRDWFRWVAETCHSATTYDCTLFNHLASKHGVQARPGWRRHCAETEDLHRSWPLPNVWLGVSVENQAAADERIPLLLETPAALRFLSCEPLLGPVNVCAVPDGKTRLAEFSARNTPLGDIDWVIAGCESGRGARPAQVDWYRALRDQCAAAGVPFFLKQAVHTSEWAPGAPSSSVPIGPGPGTGSSEKAGGVIGLPYLDGVQHAAFPEVQ